MSGATEKSLAILEYLVAYPDGASLGQIATELNQLRSGCHRTLHELIRMGYVRQLPQRGDYALTTKMASMGLSFLSKSGVVDVSQPDHQSPGAGHGGTGPAGHRRRRAPDPRGQGAGRALRPPLRPRHGHRPATVLQCRRPRLVDDPARRRRDRVREPPGAGQAAELRSERADLDQGPAEDAGRTPQARLQHHPGRVRARNELDGRTGAAGGGTDHRRDRRCRAFVATEPSAHAQVRACAAGLRRRALHQRAGLAAAEVGECRHLGQCVGQAGRSVHTRKVS